MRLYFKHRSRPSRWFCYQRCNTRSGHYSGRSSSLLMHLNCWRCQLLFEKTFRTVYQTSCQSCDYQVLRTVLKRGSETFRKDFEDQQAFWKFGTSLCTREERMLITNEDPPQKMREYTLWRKWLLSSGQKYELATAPGPFSISKWGVEL